MAEEPVVEGLPPAPVVKDPALEAMEKELAAQKDQVQRLTTAVQQQQAVPPAPPANGDKPLTKEQLEKEFFKNPLDFATAIAQKAVNDAMAQSDASSFEVLVEQARNLVRAEDTAFFDKYKIEIEAKVMQMHPQFRKQPAIWRNAVKMTKGEHVDDLINAARTQTPQGGGDGPGRPSTPRTQAAAKTPLSDEEKQVAEGLKLSHDRYRNGKSKLIDMGKGTRIDPEAWGDVITIDSDSKEAKQRADKRAAANRS